MPNTRQRLINIIKELGNDDTTVNTNQVLANNPALFLLKDEDFNLN